ncbi:hypothetical protein BDV33DRAFT_174041 [Aspergillus novoparasiticus]|uniref:Uncharacterized protein n=1 Tax=Aspergillus novoparasiticus TaxID=986946 RepID=A0A5N6ERS1_9EURO|nr:hypothetical protein BDV33DRAFT_174041 [Aspergillus novoparasiticus]
MFQPLIYPTSMSSNIDHPSLSPSMMPHPSAMNATLFRIRMASPYQPRLRTKPPGSWRYTIHGNLRSKLGYDIGKIRYMVGARPIGLMIIGCGRWKRIAVCGVIFGWWCGWFPLAAAGGMIHGYFR